MGNTAAEVGIEFNNTAPSYPTPNKTAVENTLIQAVTNPNSTFNLTVDASSIEVIRTPNVTSSSTTTAPNSNTATTAATTAEAPKTTQATTAAPVTTPMAAATTATVAITAAASTTTQATTAAPVTTPMAAATTATVAITAAASTTTQATTAAPVTTPMAAATTAVQLIKRRLTFRSAGEKFTNDLLSPSSTAFMNRAKMIKSTLEPVFKEAFSTFRSLTVISFSNGSIYNNMDIGFESQPVPNGTQIADVLVGAASNITAFNIDTTSISVDGTQVSSGVSHKISLITASFLMLLSWLLSRQH
ncbi:uncharacterized protein LOC131989974 [Centropristis striata]|uniref:uncharacterized protein LOC131989974 n=1 Tax=Centropristis striata TaxID=184440 RepID=UPI0027DFBB59|nr:uncharacterized protein LOC131989974 [Centropristis striata]